MKTGKDHLVLWGMQAGVLATVVAGLWLMSSGCYGPAVTVREAGVAAVHLAPGTREILLDVGGEPEAGKAVLQAVATVLGSRLEAAGWAPRAGTLLWTYSTHRRIGISVDPVLTDEELQSVTDLVTGQVLDRPIRLAEIRSHAAAP